MALKNPLFAFHGRNESSERARAPRFYARHSQSELAESENERRYRVHLYEAVDANWFDEYQGELGPNLVFYNEARLVLLEIRVPEQVNPGFDLLLQADEGPAAPWAEIFPGASGGPVALRAFANLFGEPVVGSVEKIQPVNRRQRTRLEQTVDLGCLPDATEDELQSALGPLGEMRLTHAVAFDVGQGNAAGLFDEEGWLRCYCDLGGGAGSHVHTFPPSLHGFCFTRKPTIILSHWDHDHWSSAYRAPESLKQTWIAPRQDIGMIQAALVAQLVATGRLLIVPDGFPGTGYGQLYLERGTGAGRNNGGLVVTLADPDGKQGEILFPGDAQYQFIPSCTAGKTYHSMVAPHHGATPSSMTRLPACAAAGTSRLVYSYGEGNTYGHATGQARYFHHAAGWHDVRVDPAASPFRVKNTEQRAVTGLGHVWLGWEAPPGFHVMNCGGGGCQLAATQ